MCGISMKDRRTNEELRRLVGVQPITSVIIITAVIRSGRMRWYGHVMRKGDEDWVRKCMEFRVEGRRLVGRPRRTWLDSVEADMAELEIDKEDVHDRKNWRRNVMKRKFFYTMCVGICSCPTSHWRCYLNARSVLALVLASGCSRLYSANRFVLMLLLTVVFVTYDILQCISFFCWLQVNVCIKPQILELVYLL